MDQSTIRVLLIEDNLGDARLIREALADVRSASFEVTWADRLSLGLKYLTDGGIDIVLLDLSLPDSHGMETFIRAHAEAPNVPIVVLTGLDDELLAVEAAQKGAQDYLSKAYVQVDSTFLVRSIRYAIERKRAERELARLASFPEQSPNPIIEMEISGAVTYLNPAARSEFPDLIPMVPGHPLVELLKAAAETLRQERKQSITLEVTLGSKVYEQHVSYLPESNVVRSYSVDVTERKQVDRLKDEFLSTVSHELRTPLTTIKEFIGIISDKIAGPVTPEQQEYFGIIKANINRLARIINDLLDMGKIEAGQIQLNKEVIHIGPMLEHVVQSMRPLAANRQIELKLDVPAPMSTIYADGDKVTQVLINLVGNAIKFTQGSGTITIRVIDEAATVQFSVIDTGVGIPTEDVPKLFQKFHQLKPMTGGSGSQGTGLGLAISKRLVELHGGNIWVTSILGQGSTFSFTLPRYDVEEVFKKYFRSGIEQAKRKQGRFSIVLIALVDFLEIKSHFGPEPTSQLLRDVEAIVRETVRRSAGDLVTRWQRGEMVVVLAEVDRGGSRAIAERIKTIINGRTFTILSQPVDVKIITATATYPDEAVTEDALLDFIERQLGRVEQPLARVLVVDDEPKIRQFLKESLEIRDFEVLTAASGLDALDSLKQQPVDLILLDLMMPVMDGYEVYHLLKENSSTKDIPVVIVTAKGERKDRQLGLEGSTYNYITKPFDIEELIGKIRSVLVQRRPARQ